jgi:hypothetical protein
MKGERGIASPDPKRLLGVAKSERAARVSARHHGHGVGDGSIDGPR